jgi:hypothetical protein
MVIDHIQEHGEAANVAGIDQAFEACRAPIGMVGRIETYPIIAPAPGAGEGVDGHQFHMGDPEVDQVIESLNGCIKGARWRKGSDVEFINHCG